MSKIRALIIDDDESFLDLTRIFLEKIDNNLEIMLFTSPYEALALLKANNIDVVVSDYIMPGLNGLELLQEIRKMGNTIPFILLTGMPGVDTKRRALNLGANSYIEKMANVHLLFQKMAELIIKCFNKEITNHFGN